MDKSIHPVAHKQRRIPHNLAQKAAHEELRLREQGVIEAVPNNQPTTWCTNPLVAPKPHSPEAIRFCPDLRVSNTTIVRPVTESLTVEALTCAMFGCLVKKQIPVQRKFKENPLLIEYLPSYQKHLLSISVVFIKFQSFKLIAGSQRSLHFISPLSPITHAWDVCCQGSIL